MGKMEKELWEEEREAGREEALLLARGGRAQARKKRYLCMSRIVAGRELASKELVLEGEGFSTTYLSLLPIIFS